MQCAVDANNTNEVNALCLGLHAPPHLCRDTFTFKSTVDLFHADREGNDSYLPLLDVSFNTSVSNGVGGTYDTTADDNSPVCVAMVRVHNCSSLCNDTQLMEYLDAPEQPRSIGQILYYPQFWMFFCLMLIAWSCFASAVTLTDTICFMMLGK